MLGHQGREERHKDITRRNLCHIEIFPQCLSESEAYRRLLLESVIGVLKCANGSSLSSVPTVGAREAVLELSGARSGLRSWSSTHFFLQDAEKAFKLQLHRWVGRCPWQIALATVVMAMENEYTTEAHEVLFYHF